jgi:hypothetical protein
MKLATALGELVAALQRIDPAGGPAPGPSNSGRGVPLALRDHSEVLADRSSS